MRVFLDSNVIMQTLPRTFIYALGEAGVITPIVSPSILQEIEHVAIRNDNLKEMAAALVETRLRTVLGTDGDIDAIELPDPHDRHVAAGAIANRAPTILTYNLRDFPLRKLRGYGLVPITPDVLFFDLWPQHEQLFRATANNLENGITKTALKKGGLSRLSKLLASV